MVASGGSTVYQKEPSTQRQKNVVNHLTKLPANIPSPFPSPDIFRIPKTPQWSRIHEGLDASDVIDGAKSVKVSAHCHWLSVVSA